MRQNAALQGVARRFLAGAGLIGLFLNH